MLRGALIATYNFWFGVGQFAGAIALQIVVKQTTYLKVIYSQWLFIGLMIIAWFLIPESPCKSPIFWEARTPLTPLQGTI